MDGLIIVVQPDGDDWQAAVWEGCEVIFEQGRYSAWATALACAQAWVQLHRPGMRYLTEIRSVPDTVRP